MIARVTRVKISNLSSSEIAIGESSSTTPNSRPEPIPKRDDVEQWLENSDHL